uniref:AlNc14C161G7778 protein n=1 Tax=Albugo laibachii Nc14 TaxID=890382 RepID=F0WMU2_9STRA|nr:AlNc14C161G7778 [Albugo laibachii Nc14]|eukprot:CCA22627.1 AlNc14C161G7778 [Albugo laibachii Nc14]
MEHFYTTADNPNGNPRRCTCLPNVACLRPHIDLSLVLNQSFYVSANNVLFLWLIHVKTSEEQSLSLFPDRETFVTCPVHAIAVALLMQSAPCISLLLHLTTAKDVAELATTASILLLKLLGGGCHLEANIIHETIFLSATARYPGIHRYENRILRNTEKVAGVQSDLTSQSSRRGEA